MNDFKSFNDFRNEISIMELAMAHNYVPDKNNTYKWPVLKNTLTGDKIIIGKSKDLPDNFYFRGDATGHDKGSIINFVKFRLGAEIPNDPNLNEHENINKVLYNYLGLEPAKKEAIKQQYNLHAKDGAPRQEETAFSMNNIRKLSDYGILLARGISKETIFSEPFKDKIFNAEFKGHLNIGFPLYANGKDTITGFEIRTPTWHGAQKASDRGSSIGLSNRPKETKNIFLTEGALDGLSKHQLEPNNNTLYSFAIGGYTQNQIHALKIEIERAGNPTLQLGFDNDKQGSLHALKVIRGIMPIPTFTEPAPSGFIRLGFAVNEAFEKQTVSMSEKIYAITKLNGFPDNSGGADKLMQKETQQGITLDARQDKFIFQIPESTPSLQLFNRALISAALEVRLLQTNVELHTPLLKDFNDDLKALNKLSKTNPSIQSYKDLKHHFLMDVDFSNKVTNDFSTDKNKGLANGNVETTNKMKL